MFTYLLLVFVLLMLLLPPSQRFKNSLLFAQKDKINHLRSTPSPRIIFIGGSNLSFSLDSKKMKDSLDRLNKERKYLITKVKCLEQEKSREMIVQKSVKDTISEK